MDVNAWIDESQSRPCEARGPLGATDLELLLTHIQNSGSSVNKTVGVLILSDFIATANERAAMKCL